MTLGHGFDAVIAAARLGAEWAWSELYREIYSHLLAYFKVHETPSPASDARAVFFDLARRLEDFEGDEGEFRLLVFGLAYERTHSEQKGAQSRLTRLTDRVVARLDSGESGESLSVDIDRALAGMTETQREIVALRVLGGLEIDQIAQLVGIRRRKVRTAQAETSAMLPQREAVPA